MKRNDRRALAVCMALTAAGALFPPAVLAAHAQPPPEASGSPQSEQDVWKVLQDAQAQKEAGHCEDAIRLYTRVLASASSTRSMASGASATTGERGVSRATAGVAAPAFTTDPVQPYAHPYYWAPFILMGNWL